MNRACDLLPSELRDQLGIDGEPTPGRHASANRADCSVTNDESHATSGFPGLVLVLYSTAKPTSHIDTGDAHADEFRLRGYPAASQLDRDEATEDCDIGVDLAASQGILVTVSVQPAQQDACTLAKRAATVIIDDLRG